MVKASVSVKGKRMAKVTLTMRDFPMETAKLPVLWQDTGIC